MKMKLRAVVAFLVMNCSSVCVCSLLTDNLPSYHPCCSFNVTDGTQMGKVKTVRNRLFHFNPFNCLFSGRMWVNSTRKVN